MILHIMIFIFVCLYITGHSDNVPLNHVQDQMTTMSSLPLRPTYGYAYPLNINSTSILYIVRNVHLFVAVNLTIAIKLYPE